MFGLDVVGSVVVAAFGELDESGRVLHFVQSMDEAVGIDGVQMPFRRRLGIR